MCMVWHVDKYNLEGAIPLCGKTIYLLQIYNIFQSIKQYDICIYFNITYIVILATCFDSYELSSGINIQELLVHIVLQFFFVLEEILQ